MQIFFLFPNAIGDFICHLPQISYIKEIFPSANIIALISSELKELVENDPHIHKSLTLPPSFFVNDGDENGFDLNGNEIIDKGFNVDLVIDTLSIRATMNLVRLLKPKESLGIAFIQDHPYSISLDYGAWKSWGLNNRTAVDCFGDLIRLIYPEFKPECPVLEIADSAGCKADIWIEMNFLAGARIVAINPGAGSSLKRWDIKNYLILAELFRSTYFEVVFLFGPKEQDLLHDSRKNLDMLKFKYIDDFGIRDTALFLKRCELLVSNDCAIMHIGAAMGTKTVAIFGPTSSRVWFPYNLFKNRVVELDMKCRENCDRDCINKNCLDLINPDVVFSASNELIGQK